MNQIKQSSVSSVSRLPFFFALLFAALLTACGGSSSNNEPSKNNKDTTINNPKTIEIYYSSLSVQIPQYLSEEVSLNALKDNGAKENISELAKLEVANNDIVKITEQNSSGIKVEGLKQGTTFIHATYKDFDAAIEVHVGSPIIEELSISLKNKINLGEEIAVQVKGSFQGGVSKDITDIVTIYSEDENILSPTEKRNIFKSESEGSTNIVAKLDDVKSTAEIDVSPAILVDAKITSALAEINQGEKIQFELMGFYSDGTEKNITNQAEWSSNKDEDIGFFSDSIKGLYKTNGYGEVIVTATLNDYVYNKNLSILAAPNAPKSISIQASPNALLANSDESSEIKILLAPNNQNGYVIDGTKVEVKIPEIKFSKIYETNNQEIGFTINATSDSKELNIDATVVGSSISSNQSVRVVSDLSALITKSSSRATSSINGVYQPGSQFSLRIANSSNRSFEIIKFESSTDMGTTTFFPEDYPTELNNGELGPGESAGLTISLQSLNRTRSVTLRYLLSDKATGREFTVIESFQN